MKKVLVTQRSETPHWVGDGFPVRSIFTYNDLAKEMSPFLLMDYAGPAEFPPSAHRKGVGEHPHRGFETVTIVYSGEVEHRDSAGGGGVISRGDVQWMTAASGVVHEEMHGENFSKTGGLFEMIQLWVNLPRKDKMTTPRYQGITAKQIPAVDIDGGSLRVIAGNFREQQGPAQTFSPINLWDIKVSEGSKNTFTVPQGHTASIFVLSGKIRIGDKEVEDATLALLETEGDRFSFEALQDSKILFLGGEPLNEPVIGYGPFVMSTQKEIYQAFMDYQDGKMGQLVKA
ncbi:MAG: pirin family protein [Bdellovibrionaceae bacterium]|nr:pirin family protein [Pseudobdellovibrionaceae bacterium]